MQGFRLPGRQRAETLLPTITFSLDTSAYGAGDLLADTQELANALAVSGGGGLLVSIKLNDKDDQTAAPLTVYILKSNVSLGTENSAPSITDANADEIICWVDIAATDWKDLGGAKVAFVKGLGIPVRVATGTSLYVALVNGTGTPTQTASGITGIFGVLPD